MCLFIVLRKVLISQQHRGQELYFPAASMACLSMFVYVSVRLFVAGLRMFVSNNNKNHVLSVCLYNALQIAWLLTSVFVSFCL